MFLPIFIAWSFTLRVRARGRNGCWCDERENGTCRALLWRRKLNRMLLLPPCHQSLKSRLCRELTRTTRLCQPSSLFLMARTASRVRILPDKASMQGRQEHRTPQPSPAPVNSPHLIQAQLLNQYSMPFKNQLWALQLTKIQTQPHQPSDSSRSRWKTELFSEPKKEPCERFSKLLHLPLRAQLMLLVSILMA